MSHPQSKSSPLTPNGNPRRAVSQTYGKGRESLKHIATLFLCLLALAGLAGCGEDNSQPSAPETATAPTALSTTEAVSVTSTALPASSTALPSTAIGVSPATALPTSQTTHLVQAGDTLGSIAAQYNTSVSTLMAANNLASDTILVGQTLKIALPEVASVPLLPTTPAPATPVASGSAASVTAISGGTSNPATYVVQPGDTLIGVADQFGVSPQALADANGISPTDFLYIDQELKIPAPGEVVAAAATPPPATTQPPSRATAQPTEATPQPDPPTQIAAASTPQANPTAVTVKGRTYDAYLPAAIKKGQWYHYTCEFDAAWIVLKTYGFDVGLDEQVEIIGLDKSIEPYYKETKDGVVIYGGDVTQSYSGNYKTNFLARSSGEAMRKLFEHYDLGVTAVNDRAGVEAALLRGELIWIKTTVDFKPWTPATWVMPDGRTYKTVLGNDHALVVMGFNKDVVVIRDPLGPTSTGRDRPYEYTVPWSKFLASWGAQSFDGLAVAPPGR